MVEKNFQEVRIHDYVDGGGVTSALISFSFSWLKKIEHRLYTQISSYPLFVVVY